MAVPQLESGARPGVAASGSCGVCQPPSGDTKSHWRGVISPGPLLRPAGPSPLAALAALLPDP